MRDTGFYIVKLDIQWEVAYWDGDAWTFVGEEDRYAENMVKVHGDKIWLPEPKDTRDFYL